MPKKKDNTYKNADEILDIMINRSGLSQTRFAKNILGIAGGNISDARKTGKIPDRWFLALEQKLGILKSEVIALAIEGKTKTLSEIEYARSTDQHRPIDIAEHLPDDTVTNVQFRRSCAFKLEDIFDFIGDTYGRDPRGVERFKELFRERMPEYRRWILFDEKEKMQNNNN